MTFRSDEPLPGDASKEELVPALSAEVQQRDPGLVALVRNLAALEMRAAQLSRPVGEEDDEVADIVAQVDAADLELRRYAEEMAISRKVDRYTSMLAWLELQREALGREAKRLTARKRAAEAIIERMLDAAQYALHMLPKPHVGPRVLDGTNSSLVLVKNPGRVRVTEHAAIPPEWRQATVKINLRLWLLMLDALPRDLREQVRLQYTITDEVMKDTLKPVLKGGQQVDGAEWVQDDRVERR